MQEPGNLQVVLMGIITVFICLVAIIIIIKLLGIVVNAFTKKETPAIQAAPVTPAPSPAAPAASVNNQGLVAAISVAIAETMGTDVSHIKIHSVKKL